MLRSLTASLFLLFSALAFAAPSQSTAGATTCIENAHASLTALAHGTYDAENIANFDAAMKTAISAQMNQFWSLLSAHYGGFDHVAAPATKMANGQLNVTLPLVFAHGRENLHVTCNAGGTIIGLFLTPSKATRQTKGG